MGRQTGLGPGCVYPQTQAVSAEGLGPGLVSEPRGCSLSQLALSTPTDVPRGSGKPLQKPRASTPSPPQVFHVAYVLIKFANAPRPDLWVLERSTDFGRTYQPWQFFACECP